MPRIRTIKPEFPQSESMGRVSRDARLLFILLWTLCDDEGRGRGNSRMLASLLYPYDIDAPALIDGWLAELEREGCVERWQDDDGATYYRSMNWGKHQKIDKPSKSKIKPPPSARDRDGSPNPPRSFANVRERSSVDQGRDQGKDQGGEGKEKSAAIEIAGADAPSLFPEKINGFHPSPDDRSWLFNEGLQWIAEASSKKATGLRGLIGQWLAKHFDDAASVRAVIEDAMRQPPLADPVAWLIRAIEQRRPAARAARNGPAPMPDSGEIQRIKLRVLFKTGGWTDVDGLLPGHRSCAIDRDILREFAPQLLTLFGFSEPRVRT